MPDLSNVHFLEKGLTWSSLAYLVLVCLAAAASFILAFFAGRVTSAKNMEIKRLQGAAAETVAHAHAQTETAVQEQRRLEADLAHAQVEHEQLRKENRTLQLALEKERAARLEAEQRLGARRISPKQRQSIQTELAGFRGQSVAIIIYPGDREIAAFANQIYDTLAAAGMIVSLTPALVFGKTQPGIALEVGAHRRQLATALAKAFVDAQVCSGPVTAMESDNADRLEITVGPKP